MQGLFLLHSEYVTASRDLLAIWLAAYPVPGEVITTQEAAVALVPAFQGYPSVVYEDAAGARHVLFNPPDLGAVAAWRESIDNPPKPTTLSKYAFSQRFKSDEMIGVLALRLTDPVVGLFLQLIDYAQDIDLTDTNIQSGVNYLVSIDKLTSERAAVILAP